MENVSNPHHATNFESLHMATMTSEDLQKQYRETLEETLNELQSVTLLIAQIEAKMDDVRQSMHSLCQIMEAIITANPSD